MLGEGPDCLGKAKNWRVTAVRFAPNQIAFPGQPGVWQKWAESQSKRADRIPEIRYVVRPFCEVEDRKTEKLITRSTDHGLHVIFRPTPEKGFDRGVVLAKGVTENQLQGQFERADALAQKNIEVLSSPEWTAYRASIIADWNAISRARASAGRESDSLQSLLNSLFSFAKGFMLGSAVSEDLKDLKNSAVSKELEKITRKYAKKENLAGVTAMSHSVARVWLFAAFRHDDNLALQSQRMLSFDAAQESSQVRLRIVAEQVQGAPIARVGSVKKMDGIDLALFQEHEGGSGNVLNSLAAFPEFKKKVTDTAATNPTTMTCESCHKLAAEFDENGEIPAVQERFLMTEGGKITILTATEVTEEAERLNAEFDLKSQ